MAPIYVRITVDGLRVELSLARTVPEEYWDKSAQIVSNKYEDGGVLNSYLTMIKGQLMSIYNQSTPVEMEHTGLCFIIT